VESHDPRLGLFAAVTRRSPSDPRGPVFGPSPPLTKDEALAAFTSGAAFASFHEADRGAFRVGATADLTLFDSDPFAPDAPDEALLSASVVWTVVGGTVEYERGAP
jgi:predicted amidohydrolase YtcJ